MLIIVICHQLSGLILTLPIFSSDFESYEWTWELNRAEELKKWRILNGTKERKYLWTDGEDDEIQEATRIR